MILRLNHFILFILIFTYNDYAYSKKHKKFDNFNINIDYGRLFINSNDIIFGSSGNMFDLKEDGGQNILFPFTRFTASISEQNHSIYFIYQPIYLKTKQVIRNRFKADELFFDVGDPIDLIYNFPYTRISYLYLIPLSKVDISFGASLQIRNAFFSITNSSGERRVIRSSVGTLGLANLKISYNLYNIKLESDINLIGLNQKRRDRGGFFHEFGIKAIKQQRNKLKLSIGLRIFKGGYAGKSKSTKSDQTRFTSNWLHATAVFFGASILL